MSRSEGGTPAQAPAEEPGEGGGQRSTVLLTTSPPLLGVCDRVVFLGSEGEVAEGTHAALMEHAGYAAAVLR